ncbi:MAG: phage tail protein [Proteobacteria bacterium]|jgi:hypothetical protein|nr:phage tail protein [Pseudomonadota bacterium]
MSGQDAAPVPGRNFRVEIVDGNGHATEVGCSEVVFPALAVHADAQSPPAEERLVLRRAANGDRVLHDWWAKACNGRAPQRRSVRVTLLAPDHERAVKRWRFRNARPASLHYSPLDAMANALVMESLAVAFDSVEIE